MFECIVLLYLLQFAEQVVMEGRDCSLWFFSLPALVILIHFYYYQLKYGVKRERDKLLQGIGVQLFLITYLYQQSIISLMSESASKSQLNRDVAADNETLFDFLKRKKKYNLQNSVNKSLYQHSYTKKKIDLDVDEQYPHTREEKTKNAYQSNNEARRTVRQTITPKKIEFDEPKRNISIVKQGATQAQTSQGKSFLSMISPIKNRAAEERHDDKENVPKSNKKASKANESFSKKNVTKCINSIKQAMNGLCDKVRGLKQKSHGLVLQFNPLFNYVAESNAPIASKVGDFRNKLKSFQSLIDAVDTENSDEIVEAFHKNLQEHLQLEEGNIKKSFEKAKQEQVSSIKAQKDKIIDRLQQQNKKLNKELDLLSRRLQKIQSSHQNMEQAVTEREVNGLQQIQRLKISYEANIQQLKAKNRELTDKNQTLLQKNKYYQRQFKNERFSKESIEQKCRQQIQYIIQAKDAYLLNEIMVLKAQFNTDLNRVNELHKIKQAQFVNRIQKKDQQINKLSFERGCDRQIESKMIQEANVIKQQNVQLKAKADCIITDMYRMNQQLYQHWMALKDIKALSTRLGSFAQYRKIYEDLLFNDHLFH